MNHSAGRVLKMLQMVKMIFESLSRCRRTDESPQKEKYSDLLFGINDFTFKSVNFTFVTSSLPHSFS